MRLAGAMSILAFGAGSTAIAQEIPQRDQQIADLQKQIEAIQEQLRALQGDAATEAPSLQSRLDGAVRQSPSEALREPRRLNVSAPMGEGVDVSGNVNLFAYYWGNYDQGFTGGHGNDDALTLGTEAAVNIDAKISEKTSAHVTLHFGELWGDATFTGIGSNSKLDGVSSSQSPNVSMTRANVMVRDMYDSGFDMTAGRQTISLGAERQMGDDEWLLQRTFVDAFRFDRNLGEGQGNVTLFASRISDGSASGGWFGPTTFTDTRQDTDLYGLYYTNSCEGCGAFDIYVFHVEDPNYSDSGSIGRTRFTTYGGRWQSSDFGGLTFEAEAATQFGQCQGLKTNDYGFDTWAGHACAKYSMDDGSPVRNVFVGYDYASGGNQPYENYMQILPSLHGRFGLTDFFSWTNIQHWVVGMAFACGEGSITAGWHWNRLASDNAGYFGYYHSGSPVAGNRDDLGQEAMVVYSVPCSQAVNVDLGVGYFFPGGGFTDMNGIDDNITVGTLRTTFRF